MTIQITNIQEQVSCSIARGLRLKSVRQMTGLSRSTLEHKYGISAHTLQSWEKAKAGGLTQKGAFRMLEVLKSEGIHCSPEWLLYGIGKPAQLHTAHFALIQQDEVIREKPATYIISKHDTHNVINELLVFRSLNQHVIDYIVEDDGLSPFYMPGDYVAGKKRYGSEITTLVGMNCIVQTVSNEILLRRILRCTQSGFYNLTCINPETSVMEYVCYEQELLSAAPVIWHRKPSQVDVIN